MMKPVRHSCSFCGLAFMSVRLPEYCLCCGAEILSVRLEVTPDAILVYRDPRAEAIEVAFTLSNFGSQLLNVDKVRFQKKTDRDPWSDVALPVDDPPSLIRHLGHRDGSKTVFHCRVPYAEEVTHYKCLVTLSQREEDLEALFSATPLQKVNLLPADRRYYNGDQPWLTFAEFFPCRKEKRKYVARGRVELTVGKDAERLNPTHSNLVIQDREDSPLKFSETPPVPRENHFTHPFTIEWRDEAPPPPYQHPTHARLSLSLAFDGNTPNKHRLVLDQLGCYVSLEPPLTLEVDDSGLLHRLSTHRSEGSGQTGVLFLGSRTPWRACIHLSSPAKGTAEDPEWIFDDLRIMEHEQAITIEPREKERIRKHILARGNGIEIPLIIHPDRIDFERLSTTGHSPSPASVWETKILVIRIQASLKQKKNGRLLDPTWKREIEVHGIPVERRVDSGVARYTLDVGPGETSLVWWSGVFHPEEEHRPQRLMLDQEFGCFSIPTFFLMGSPDASLLPGHENLLRALQNLSDWRRSIRDFRASLPTVPLLLPDDMDKSCLKNDIPIETQREAAAAFIKELFRLHTPAWSPKPAQVHVAFPPWQEKDERHPLKEAVHMALPETQAVQEVSETAAHLFCLWHFLSRKSPTRPTLFANGEVSWLLQLDLRPGGKSVFFGRAAMTRSNKQLEIERLVAFEDQKEDPLALALRMSGHWMEALSGAHSGPVSHRLDALAAWAKAMARNPGLISPFPPDDNPGDPAVNRWFPEILACCRLALAGQSKQCEITVEEIRLTRGQIHDIMEAAIVEWAVPFLDKVVERWRAHHETGARNMPETPDRLHLTGIGGTVAKLREKIGAMLQLPAHGATAISWEEEGDKNPWGVAWGLCLLQHHNISVVEKPMIAPLHGFRLGNTIIREEEPEVIEILRPNTDIAIYRLNGLGQLPAHGAVRGRKVIGPELPGFPGAPLFRIRLQSAGQERWNLLLAAVDDANLVQTVNIDEVKP